MPKLDISKAADFNVITQGAFGATLGLFGGQDPRLWDLKEGSYNGVIFHVFSSKTSWQGALSRAQGSGGRRKAVYKYPYRDGQTTDDLGRKGNTFDMDILIFGLHYMEGYRALLAEFDKPTPGKLVHPVRGEITCVVDEYTETHESGTRKAVALQVKFIEHNFTIGNIRQLKDSTVKGALSAALKIFNIINAAAAKIEGAVLLARGVKNLLNSYLATYNKNNASTLTQMNSTFNSKGGSADIPGLLPTEFGGIRNSDGTTSSDTFKTVSTPSDPFNAVPVDALSQDVLVATAVNNLTKQVIARRDELSQIINTIYDNGGALELYDTVVELKQTAVLLQDVLEKGVASSQARVIDYQVPRVMSLREVAFANGVDVNRVQELDLLNPFLLSTNYITPGVVLKIPVS